MKEYNMAVKTISKPTKSKTTKPRVAPQSKSLNKILGLLAGLLVIVVGYLIVNSYASTGTRLFIAPSATTLTSGQNATFEVYVDASDYSVNAVQADIIYPADKFNFVNIDTANSSFSVEAQNTGGEGKISIARGNVEPVTGTALIAKFTLQPILAKGVKSSPASISFGSSSIVASATDNTNILQTTDAGEYIIAASKSNKGRR
jgi:hypothetical protein